MASKESLFSRVRPGNPTPKKIRGFMGLPGELRNEVYGYYFQEGFRCEIAAKEAGFDQLADKAPPEPIKLCVGMFKQATMPTPSQLPVFKNGKKSEPAVLRVSRCWGNYKHVQGRLTKWETSLCALVLVCKQIHRESVIFLYHNTKFVFESPKRINNFFRWVPTANLFYVTKLQLHYVPHHDDEWKATHQLAWSNVCKAFTKKLVNLQDLTIFIHVGPQGVRWLALRSNHESLADFIPLHLDLRRDFVQPLLQFRRLSIPKTTTDSSTFEKTLKVIKVHFSSYWSRKGFPNEALTHASNHLHRLYGIAIEKAIAGASEEEAMAEFMEAWMNKYAQWRHHLNYNETGW